MKFASCKTFIIALCFFLGCKGPSADELIIGKWNFSYMDFSSYKGEDYDPNDTARLNFIKGVFKNATTDYRKDKSYETILDGTMGRVVQPGTYEITDEGKAIIIQNKNSQGETIKSKNEFLVLNADSMKQKSEEGLVLAFSKAK